MAQKYCRKTVDDQCISEGLDDYEEYWEAPEPEGEPSFIDDETSTQLYLAELAFRARCRANLREFLMEDEERLNEEMWAQAC